MLRPTHIVASALALLSCAALPATQPAFDVAPPGTFRVAYHGRFAELPVGAVRPKGWIKSWLQRQAAGLTGHPENLAYPYDTCMYAGRIPPPPVPHGESWWGYEQSGYFVDGAVRLNLLLDSPATALVPRANLAYILHNAGPAKLGESTWGWPNAVVGRALMAQYSATGDADVARALYDCLVGTRSVAGRDGYVFEEALYLYGLTGDDRLLALARRAYDRYFVADPRSFSTIARIRGGGPLRSHGVTAAEQLKLLPMLYAYAGDPELLKLADVAYRKVEADALMPDGGIVSSEGLGTAAFNSMHETCDLTDWSWSMGYLLLAGGDGHWADRIEQATFNALPGAVTKDFRQLQYFSAPNQILASNSACSRISPTRMSYRPAHDTECCTGNVNRAMPNYVTRMWTRTGDGLAATLLGPSEVTTTVNGQRVVVAEETDYPFRDTISLTVHLPTPATFSLAVRIPEWCSAPTVRVNDSPWPSDAKPGGFAVIDRPFRDGDRVVVHLPMAVRLKEWFGGRAVSVERGPLVYSVPVPVTRVESKEDPAAVTRVLKGNALGGFPAVEFFPAGEWRYGVDAASRASVNTFAVTEAPVADNPFDAASVPVRIAVPLRLLPGWEPNWSAPAGPFPKNPKAATKNPADLPADDAQAAPGPATAMTLVPLGATYLRLTTLPLTRQP